MTQPARDRLPVTRLGLMLGFFAALALLPPVAVALGDPFLVVVFTRIMIFAIAALSLDLILGYGAMVSFGHAAYVGLGAYAVAVLTRLGVGDIVLHLAAAIGAAALFALVTGAIALRTRGVYFIMITLAFGQMAYFFFVSLSVMGGDDGVTLPQRSTLAGLPLFESTGALYYLVLAVLAGSFLLCRSIVGARFGRVLRGVRENGTRMQAIGYRPFGYQLTAFVIAGCLAAVAGVLLANQTNFVSPAFMTWHRSGELMVMVILGGLGSLGGAVFGAFAVLLLEEVLAGFSSHWRLGLGLALILVVLFAPGGLTGAVQRLTGRGR